MEKPIPKIATRALAMLANDFMRMQQEMIEEAAEATGVDTAKGWKINKDGTAFVKDDEETTDDTE